MKTGSRPSRRILATGAAVCAHLLALLALGVRIPRAPAPAPVAAEPALQLTIVRPARPLPPTASSRRVADTRLARPVAPTSQAPSPLLPPQAPLSVPPLASAQGPPDCEPEDLPLLNEAERARCRNQIDADKARQAARLADERTARLVARAQGAPQMSRIDADKQASYDAAAQQQSDVPSIAGRGPVAGRGSHIGVGVSCSHVNIPLLSGVETNPNLFAKKHKQERPAHGPASCSAGLR